MLCRCYDPPLKLVCYFQQQTNSETAAITAATATVTVYYIKMALKGLKSYYVRVKTPLSVSMLFPNMFSKF